MAALSVGLFAPFGLTAFAVGMDRYQRRVENLGTRRHGSLHAASKDDAATPPPHNLPGAVSGVPAPS